MIRTFIQRIARPDAGSATVEAAILTPLLLLLVVGASDFARVYRAQIAVVGAAEAGAQYGSRNKIKSGDVEGMKDAARHDARDLREVGASANRFCKCGGATISCTSTCGGGHAPEVYVEVTATTTFNTAVRYPGIPSTISLGHTSTMRVQ